MKKSLAQTATKLISLLSLTSLGLLGACAEVVDPGEPEDGGGAIEPRTLCGADDMVYVNDYHGTLGPTEAFVQAKKRFVGALEDSGTNTSRKFCSGTLIGADLFLTANHCITTSPVVGKYVAFNYERAAGSTTLLAQSHYRVDAVLEAGLGADFAILRLAGSPGLTWGIAPVAVADPPVGAAITIIGHAKGGPKKIEAGTVLGFSTKTIQYNNLDTLGGQSGSAIWNDAGEIVGVHTNGGCTSRGTGYNYGQRISTIRAGSSIL
ncbi:MAG: trypsin-like peptidase domain-containing protein [Kofleriaceae bacterium]